MKRRRVVRLAISRMCEDDEAFVPIVAAALREHADYIEKAVGVGRVGRIAQSNGIMVGWEHETHD